MAGNGDSGRDEVQQWLDQVFDQLQALTDEAVAVLVNAEPPVDAAEAEKRARAVGVVARTAKAVAALKVQAKSLSRKVAGTEVEDDVAGRGEPIGEAEEQRLRDELFARVDRLFEVAEQKGYGPKPDRPDGGAGVVALDGGDAGGASGAGL
ncbi:hypothetical protein WEU32_11830 [Brevundimonas sp. BH3]|uniref:hypothetical protein n=1 Tax=Brevundimonas sp. BH3 TaxID=3133089 RepID=UPI00324444BA